MSPHSQTRRQWMLVSASLALLVAFISDLVTGPSGISAHDVLATLLRPADAGAGLRTIVWELRMPVALLAVLIGAALGTAGAEMQTVLNNPLASPYTLGVSSAAAFGAAVAMAFGNSIVSLNPSTLVPVSAFVFAMTNTLIVLWVGRLKFGSVEAIVLCGVALLFLFHSAVAAIQYFASEDTLQAIVFWTFGSVQSASWAGITLVAGALAISIPILISWSWQLTALRLGDDHARALGVNVDRLRLITLFLVSALTAIAVSFSGTIGFVGLVAPHISRITIGEDHRFFLPFSALIGGVILSLASTLAKSVLSGAILPLGIVTSLVGIPFFFSIVIAGRMNHW